MMERIYKVSVERCIACGKCELACAFAHGSEGKPAKTRINIFRRGPELGTPVVCFQCARRRLRRDLPDRGARSATPSPAPSTWCASAASSCRMCVAACPFGNMLWDEAYHCVQKCDLCGGDPKCVPFCPTGALAYVRGGRGGAAARAAREGGRGEGRGQRGER